MTRREGRSSKTASNDVTDTNKAVDDTFGATLSSQLMVDDKPELPEHAVRHQSLRLLQGCTALARYKAWRRREPRQSNEIQLSRTARTEGEGKRKGYRTSFCNREGTLMQILPAELVGSKDGTDVQVQTLQGRYYLFGFVWQQLCHIQLLT